MASKAAREVSILRPVTVGTWAAAEAPEILEAAAVGRGLLRDWVKGGGEPRGSISVCGGD